MNKKEWVNGLIVGTMMTSCIIYLLIWLILPPPEPQEKPHTVTMRCVCDIAKGLIAKVPAHNTNECVNRCNKIIENYHE